MKRAKNKTEVRQDWGKIKQAMIDLQHKNLPITFSAIEEITKLSKSEIVDHVRVTTNNASFTQEDEDAIIMMLQFCLAGELFFKVNKY